MAGGYHRAQTLEDRNTKLLPAHPEWMRQATCLSVDPDLFFPEKSHPETVREAKKVCAICPVTLDCLEHALAAKETYGIWGGLDAKERDNLQRRRRRRAA
jgi:WhiB family redox-sensing transcriptional regulator